MNFTDACHACAKIVRGKNTSISSTPPPDKSASKPKFMNATQYNKINELISEFSTLAAAFDQAEAEIKSLQLAAAKELLPKHAELKVKLTELEAQLKTLADQHEASLFPDDKRTHATPFGSLKYVKSTSLEVTDEEKSILKIKLACVEELARESTGATPRFTEAQLLRTIEELDLEALAKCDDATLALFGIVRVTKDNFKVVPFAMKSDKPAKATKATKLQEAA